MQETQTDLLTWNAAGRIEILAPDQSKINVSRCSLKIWRQKTSNLEFKLALTPEALQTLKKDFQNLMTQDNVHRFRMKRHVLEQIVGQLPKQLPDNLDWLKLEQGSILRLENYDWVGSSAWFPDESVE